MTEHYERYDACRAIVTSRCAGGAYLELDNGESAFSNKFGNLKAGTRVICKIIFPSHGKRRAQVDVESVDYDYAVA